MTKWRQRIWRFSASRSHPDYCHAFASRAFALARVSGRRNRIAYFQRSTRPCLYAQKASSALLAPILWSANRNTKPPRIFLLLFNLSRRFWCRSFPPVSRWKSVWRYWKHWRFNHAHRPITINISIVKQIRFSKFRSCCPVGSRLYLEPC